MEMLTLRKNRNFKKRKRGVDAYPLLELLANKKRVAGEQSVSPTHTLMKTFRRYIQYRISHITVNVIAPCNNGTNSDPNRLNAFAPRCRSTILWISGFTNEVAMQ